MTALITSYDTRIRVSMIESYHEVELLDGSRRTEVRMSSGAVHRVRETVQELDEIVRRTA